MDNCVLSVTFNHGKRDVIVATTIPRQWRHRYSVAERDGADTHWLE
jgi:hypothetical protein